jgi:hypothetical protein
MRPAVAGQYGRMDLPRHVADLYETPPEAIDMLLRHMTLEVHHEARDCPSHASGPRLAV